MFIALELPPTDSLTLQILYASRAGAEATDRFASSIMDKMVIKSRTETRPGATDRDPQFVVASLTCDLKQYHDDPVVAFICGIAVLLGQGLML
jgi:hypothetical protein